MMATLPIEAPEIRAISSHRRVKVSAERVLRELEEITAVGGTPTPDPDPELFAALDSAYNSARKYGRGGGI